MAIWFAHVVVVADAVVLVVLVGNTGFNCMDTAFAAAERSTKLQYLVVVPLVLMGKPERS
jgi:hypothetical protein